jgi:hypothetical protein
MLATPLLLVTGCSNVVDIPLGPQPPYLAVVVLVDAQQSDAAQGPYTFRVRELSGVLNVDTVFRASTRDTAYFSVKPAEYNIDISDVPASCGIRGGSRAYANVLPNTNTTLVRFHLTCRNALTLTTMTFGQHPDSSYAWLLTGPGGVIRTGELAGNDTILVDNLSSGTWDLELRLVQANCVVTSDGGERVPAELSDKGGATHRFIIRCSDIPRRPQVLVFRGTYQDGAVGFFAEVVDKERDIDNYTYNITNCRGLSVLPNKGFYLYPLRGAINVSYADTARIIGGFEVDIPGAQLKNLCQSFWVGDGLGNTTPIIEIPLVPRSVTESPVATRFNAVMSGTTSLAVDLAVADQGNDFAGCFVTYVLRDGIVTAPLDGKLDWLVFQPAGIIGAAVPNIPLNIGYGAWSDYYGARVYLLDRAGNMTRLEDMILVQ